MPLTDEKWDEVSQSLPKPSDPFIQKFLEGREALMREEDKQRSDASFRQSLTPVAKRACAIVSRIRDDEARTIWTSRLEDELAHEGPVFPGMMFSLSKERMESTKLWRIVRRMPKGALLHAHMDAMVDYDFLLEELLKTPGMHVSSDRPLDSAAARAEAAIKFRFRAETQQAENGAIWSTSYEPGSLVLLTNMAESFPDEGRAGFLKWAYSRCVLSRTDSLTQHHGIDAIWAKFINCFRFVASIIHYEPIFRVFLRRLMHLLHRDGIRWVELRFGWEADYCREGCETPEPDYSTIMDVVDEEVAQFKASDDGKGFWGLRIIWATIRSKNRRQVIQDMEGCLATKLSHPHLIAGYDLVGQEDLGRPLRDLLPELFWFRKQCATEEVILPFFFHAGETLGSGNEADRNLYDAILLGTRRIGHGFSLYKHPLLADLVKEKKILVESCPISNEVLRLCGSVVSHPLPALLARGVSCALCNDDPAMLGQDTAGSTHDAWQALQGWENLGLAGLGSLAENSIRWAAFEDQTAEEWTRDVTMASLGDGIKAQRLKEWAVEWENFCAWIVDEFENE